MASPSDPGRVRIPPACWLGLEDVARPFTPAGGRLFVRMEGWLMRHPTAVRLVFSDRFRRCVSRPLAPLLKRLRGGSHSWYAETGEETQRREPE